MSKYHSSQQWPTGTLTFLFTDIEDSTLIWEQYPDQMRIAMRRHDELVESAVEQHDGFVVRPRGEGDSRFAVFTRASNALRAAMDIRRLMFSEPGKMPSLRIRIALHSGEADFRDGDYYGSTVNRCARLRNASHGGQILLSQATYCLVQDDLPAGVSLHALGEYSLLGLNRPENIYQVTSTDILNDFPPLKTPDQIHSNLPLELTSFVGRDNELEDLEQLLWQTRLLTIIGAGGAGKTRLAVQLAQKVMGSFPDGVWFLDLASLSNASQVFRYIMSVLGVREEAGFPPDQTLLDSLTKKAILLILDNCEHLLPGIAKLAETLLRHTTRVRLLATTRAKLDAAGEYIWCIPPLSLPDGKKSRDIDNLLRYESVRLFQDRATAAWPKFLITRDNASSVAAICLRLDGLPLAIELAAARVRVLSVDEILRRLDDRFRLLIGARTALPRQQTLRALIDWSYDMLTEKERIMLRRLSVFSGTWTLKAAERVCSGEEIETWEILDLLTGLVDKSFAIAVPQKGPERFRFLETILKFSHERLQESSEMDALAHRHAIYYLDMANTSYGKLWGLEQAATLDWLDDEVDNLRSALGYFSNHPGNEERMLELAGSLWRYWEIRGFITEGREWLEGALELNRDAPAYWRANGLGGAGHLARQQGDYERSKALHAESLDLFRSIGCKLGAARQLNAIGEIASFQGDYDRAVELHQESLAIRFEINDTEGLAVSLRQLGVVARDRGQYEYARELLEESLRLVRELGDRLLMALAMSDLGLVAYHLCDYSRAYSLFEEAKSLQSDLNDRLGTSNSLQNLGNVAKDQGDFKQAVLLYEECLDLKRDLGDKRGISRVTASLAEVAFLQGKYPMASLLAEQSFSISKQLGVKRVMLHSMVVLGFTSFYQGNYHTASTLASQCLDLAAEINAPQAIGYIKVLAALVKYSEGSLAEAKDQFQEALAIFQQINDSRNIARTYVNLARMAFHLGDRTTAMHFLEKSVSISQKLNTRWTLGFVYEIMGLIQRSLGNYESALGLFLESLQLSLEQENQQGIANCLGALAGLAVMANQAERSVRLFAAAEKIRGEMGAKMSGSDSVEYEKYTTMVHQHLDHAAFHSEWSKGFSMPTERIISELMEWSGNLKSIPVDREADGLFKRHLPSFLPGHS